MGKYTGIEFVITPESTRLYFSNKSVVTLCGLLGMGVGAAFGVVTPVYGASLEVFHWALKLATLSN
jgi:hypothetical protein